MKVNITFEVKKFTLGLQTDAQAKIARVIDLLEEFGYQLRMPLSKKVSGGMFELRVRGRQDVRIFYCFYQAEIYLLSGFIKKSQKIPTKELTKAENRLKIIITGGDLT